MKEALYYPFYMEVSEVNSGTCSRLCSKREQEGEREREKKEGGGEKEEGRKGGRKEGQSQRENLGLPDSEA